MTRILEMTISGFGVFNDSSPPSIVQLADRGRVVILGENTDTLAADSNGAGKTTIFKALSWCLYGKTIDGLRASQVINKGSKSAHVVVRFENSGVTYIVSRHRTPKTGKLEFGRTTDGDKLEDLTQTKSAETQKSIIEKLGLDWDAFRCTVLFGQGDHSRFASPTMGDAARKAVLSTILRLDQYEDARDAARDRVADAVAFIARQDRSIQGFERKLADIEVKKAKHEGTIETNEEILSTGSATVAEKEVERNKAKKELARYKSEVSKFDEELAEIRKEKTEIVELVDRAKDNARATGAAVREAARRASSLATEGPCSECGQPRPYDAEAHEEAKRLWTAARKRDDRAKKALGNIQAEAKKLATELDEVETDRRQSERCRVTAERHSTNMTAEIEALGAQMGKASGRMAEAESAIEELVAKANVIKTGRKAAEDHKAEKLKRKALAEWWVKGFGPKGVPAYAIEQSLPVLNEKANRHLLALADGDIEVRWTATTIGSSGVEKEELTQNVVIEGIEGAAPSGGQSKKIELGTELALAEIKQDSESIGIDILLLDEALDGLDAEGQARVVEWVQTMPHGSVFVVSHDDTIAESFDSRLIVRKEGSSSTIRSE